MIDPYHYTILWEDRLLLSVVGVLLYGLAFVIVDGPVKALFVVVGAVFLHLVVMAPPRPLPTPAPPPLPPVVHDIKDDGIEDM